MFRKQVNGYNVPMPGTVDYFEVRRASRGGGYIVNMIVDGKSDTMVFSDEVVLTQTLTAMLNSAAFANLSRVSAEGQVVDSASASKSEPEAAPKKKGKGGRPPLSAEEKERRKALRQAQKLNGTKASDGAAAAQTPMQEAA